MPRYRIDFEETCTYSVEVDLPKPPDDGDDEWFNAMEQQHPNWQRNNFRECCERDINDWEQLEGPTDHLFK